NLVCLVESVFQLFTAKRLDATARGRAAHPGDEPAPEGLPRSGYTPKPGGAQRSPEARPALLYAEGVTLQSPGSRSAPWDQTGPPRVYREAVIQHSPGSRSAPRDRVSAAGEATLKGLDNGRPLCNRFAVNPRGGGVVPRVRCATLGYAV